jgi:Sec-independent protein secretion pathway component TatC
MLLLAAPMVVLYFLALGVALIHDKRKARRELRDIEAPLAAMEPERITPA